MSERPDEYYREPVGPDWQSRQRREQSMRQIVTAQQHVDEAEHELRDAVRDAREQGLTWEQVGDALGVTKQTAWERFWRACTGHQERP